MIFGHLGLAFLIKSKYYKKSLIVLIICCYLPDILYTILFGIQWTITMNYSPVMYGAFRWILSISESEFLFVGSSLPLSHSVIIYVIFLSIFLVFFSFRNKKLVGLVYTAAVFSHLLFDYLLHDANIAAPIVYPLYPFDPSLNHYLEPVILDANLFWMIDLLVFMLGFFVILWAFSKKEGRGELAY